MMLSFLGFVYSIKTLLLAGSAGALAGATSYLFGRIIPGISGLVGSALVGALVLLGANTLIGFDNSSDVLTRVKLAQEQAKVKALEFEKAALAKALEAQKRIEEEANKRLSLNEDKLKELKETLKKRKEDCPVAATEDELDIIRGIK